MSSKTLTATTLTIGTEITSGATLDTNTRSIAQVLTANGYRITETFSVADVSNRIARALSRLCAEYDLVVTTGGLGPTHDDMTLAAAVDTFGLSITENNDLYERLRSVADAQLEPAAAEQVLRQATVPVGATIIMPSVGTAPGLVIPLQEYDSTLLLLPGPPAEMLPMLYEFIGQLSIASKYRIARCVGVSESDAQILAQETLKRFPGINLTVLASPGDVRLMLIDDCSKPGTLDRALVAISKAFGIRCYSTDDKSLPEVLADHAKKAGVKIATAESCTGGLVGSAITSVAGSSKVYIGGVIAYDNSIKSDLLRVDPRLINEHGAVSVEVARGMAAGALTLFGSDIALSVTGIAGPGGGSRDKPVGLVIFAIATSIGGLVRTASFARNMRGDRERIRERSTIFALDLLRRAILTGEVR